MGVKGGFWVECGGEDCAAREQRRLERLGSDRRAHGRTLGQIGLDESDGRAVWYAFENPNRPRTKAMWWTTKVHVEAGEDWLGKDADGYDTLETVDFRVTCDRCGRAWVFTVEELTQRYDELARREPPVATAGDIGRLVGS